jgi:polar amino acid transport system substrate-binding protein
MLKFSESGGNCGKNILSMARFLGGLMLNRLVCLMIFWMGALVFAAEKNLDLGELPVSRVISVTGHPNYAPFIWKNSQNGELTGLSIEMLQMALQGSGIQIKTVAFKTWGRAQKEAEEGHIDILVPPYRNEERLSYYSYLPKPMLEDVSVLFVRKGHVFKFEKLTDLEGKTGVAVIGDSFGNEFDRFSRDRLKINHLATLRQCFSFLLKGRADFVVEGASAGRAVATRMNVLSQIEILKKPVVVTGVYVALSKKSPWNRPEFLAYLEREFQKLQASGKIPSLIEKYQAAYVSEGPMEPTSP